MEPVSTITHAGGVIAPEVINGWSSTREARTIAHTILGSPAPDITLRPAAARRGVLRCVFAEEADAAAAVEVFATPQVLTFIDDDRPTLAGAFVVTNGDITLDLDGATADVWVVSVPFAEVVP